MYGTVNVCVWIMVWYCNRAHKHNTTRALAQTGQSSSNTISKNTVLSRLFHTKYILQGIKANPCSSQNSKTHFQREKFYLLVSVVGGGTVASWW